MVLAELRAAAAVHGQLALVHLDAHADIWESYYGARYFHGTVFKRAVEEGLVDASASVQAGMRGTLYGESDIEEPRRLGYDAIYWDELEQLTRRPTATGCGPGSVTARRSCRSTSTSSIRRSRRRPARPRWAALRAARRWPTCARCTGSTSAASTASRWHPSTTSRPTSPPGWRPAPASRCCRCWRRRRGAAATAP
jgi:Arginase/agmatinase/formimionoglutamate hydrolase, arginase family